MIKYILVLLAVLFSTLIYSQQESSKNVEVITVDGTRLKGQLIERTDDKVILNSTSLGRVELLSKDIKQIIYADVASSNSIDYYNSTRYLISPNGYLLKKGQSYYENVGVFFNSVAFGVTDNFNIAVGGEIASLLFGGRFPIVYVSPKVGIPFKDEGGSWSIGSTFFSSPADDFSGFGFINTSITLGSRNSNVSLGTGFGYNFSNGFSDNVIPIMAGGVHRLGPKLSLVTDNFLLFYDDLDDSFAVLSFGVRFHFANGGALNASLWRPTVDSDDFLAFPFVSATIPLGR